MRCMNTLEGPALGDPGPHPNLVNLVDGLDGYWERTGTLGDRQEPLRGLMGNWPMGDERGAERRGH